jgi:uncharacterized protein YkwD
MRHGFTPTAVLAALLVWAARASAGEADGPTQLVDAINHFRGEVQSCAGQGLVPLPPLARDPRLVVPPASSIALRDAMAQAVYPMVNVRAISLSGPRDAGAAMQVVRESFCQVVLDPQFIDIGVSQQGRDWRVVVARPLLTARLASSADEGRRLLEQLNAARAQARQCGAEAFAATTPLAWNARLADAAQSHSRAMANQDFFDHLGRDGHTPGDRTELAGYSGRLIGENIAAGYDTAGKVLQGWLDSPGHCANLMNPAFRELGAAYAVDPKSSAGIYWTADFGTQ